MPEPDDSSSPASRRGTPQDHEAFDNTDNVAGVSVGSIDNFYDEDPTLRAEGHIPGAVSKVGGDETGLWDDIKGA